MRTLSRACCCRAFKLFVRRRLFRLAKSSIGGIEKARRSQTVCCAMAPCSAKKLLTKGSRRPIGDFSGGLTASASAPFRHVVFAFAPSFERPMHSTGLPNFFSDRGAGCAAPTAGGNGFITAPAAFPETRRVGYNPFGGFGFDRQPATAARLDAISFHCGLDSAGVHYGL